VALTSRQCSGSVDLHSAIQTMADRLAIRWAIPTGWKAARSRSVLPRARTAALLPERTSSRHLVPHSPLLTPYSPLPTPLSFLDTATSAAAPISPLMRGTTPFRYRERTCARARGVVRWGSMVNALVFQRTCYRVTGHLRARQVLGETPFLDEVTA